eukprot:COSAG02_NODE_27891_length_600_cov_2.818363_1_plen_20_part_10
MAEQREERAVLTLEALIATC